jgi:hypothetical protein
MVSSREDSAPPVLVWAVRGPCRLPGKSHHHTLLSERKEGLYLSCVYWFVRRHLANAIFPLASPAKAARALRSVDTRMSLYP